MAGAQPYPERPLEESVASRASPAEQFDGVVGHARHQPEAAEYFDGAIDECEEVIEVPRVDREHPSNPNRPNRAQYTHTCICQERQASPEAKQVRMSKILCLNNWLK